MTIDQFHALATLARLKVGSMAHKGALRVLIAGKTQTQAASELGCAQSTVSAAVRRIKTAQRLSNQGAIRY